MLSARALHHRAAERPKSLSPAVRLRCAWLGIAPQEVEFARRGFRAAPTARAHLEEVGRTFLTGYHAALTTPRDLRSVLAAVAPPAQGFAWEGAAMALTLVDLLTSWRFKRLKRLIEECPEHTYMIHVGAGWAAARLGFGLSRLRRSLDPLLAWLAVDGFGFHEGYFKPQVYVAARRPPRLAAHQARVFDHGLGRSLLFSQGAEATRLAATVAAFPDHRRGDLWSGVGLAVAYAGGLAPDALRQLLERAGDHAGALAQGAAFAAAARCLAGNPTDHTDAACRVLCDRSATAAAVLVDEARAGLAPGGPGAYERWRCETRAGLAGGGARKGRLT